MVTKLFNKSTDAPKVVAYKLPKLYISTLAMRKMELYIDGVTTEIGWLGTIDLIDEKSQSYYLDDVYLAYQEVHGATTEITPEGMMKIAQEIGDEKVPKLSFWGHSHVNMGVTPSGQDNDQVKLYKDNGLPYMFRAIGNKKGAFNLTFYDFVTGVSIENVEWELHIPLEIDIKAITEEIAEKVTAKTFPVSPYARDILGYKERFFQGDDQFDFYEGHHPIGFADFPPYKKERKTKKGKTKSQVEFETARDCTGALHSLAQRDLCEGTSQISVASIALMADCTKTCSSVDTPDIEDFLMAYDMEWWELRNMVRIAYKGGKLDTLLGGGK